MTTSAGPHYTVSGNTITPVANFNGTLHVNVTVNDGTSSSATYPVQVTVLPVNDIPTITGQNPISLLRDQSIVIELSHVKVFDPDNTYPNGFELTVLTGDNYIFADNLVTPIPGFTGTLSVTIIVNDGIDNSLAFHVKIQITIPPNIVPKIIGHTTLTTFENQPITIQLANLVVEDPDNTFPNDFTLTVLPGTNYTVAGTTLTPTKNFTGTLTVKVIIKDKTASSTPYNLPVHVQSISKTPLITSQIFLRVKEDSEMTILFSHLIVIDTDNTYPKGFSLTVFPGLNHAVINETTVKPEPDFNGYLSVPVTVSDGVNTSASYTVAIHVEPVNDAPAITHLETEPLLFEMNKSPVNISENLNVMDIDNDSIFFGEVSFISETFDLGDTLLYNSTDNIRGIYDHRSGVLTLIGKASASEYQNALHSIHYEFRSTSVKQINKTISITVSDGKTSSGRYQRQISVTDESAKLDIPEGFTPNGDGNNDLWYIRPLQENKPFTKATIRVYSKRGQLVYESTDLTTGWDGRYNDSPLPTDTYFYTINFHNAQTENRIRGIVVLLR